MGYVCEDKKRELAIQQVADVPQSLDKNRMKVGKQCLLAYRGRDSDFECRRSDGEATWGGLAAASNVAGEAFAATDSIPRTSGPLRCACSKKTRAARWRPFRFPR